MGAAPGGSLGRIAIVAVSLIASTSSLAEPVAVAHWEGQLHGFVALRTLDGTPLADGDLIQTTVPSSSGNRVKMRLVFRFKDGSTHEETTVYVQRKTFRFVSNHVVQKGPAFETQIESTIAASGQVEVRYTGEDGKEHRIAERLELPGDVANGMILALLTNISPRKPKTTVSFVAITPKPRLVKLEFVPAGEEPFSTAASPRKATRFVVKVNVPGVAGAVGALLGKTPPDSHVWVLSGEAPALLKAELPLSPGGPTWRIEMVSPVWPAASAPPKESSEAKGSVAGKP